MQTESGNESAGDVRPTPRWLPYALLALANLFWAGNWVIGRALRESFAPFTLSFLRWLVAALVLAPFAVSALRGKGALVRRHLGLLLVLALAGGVMFQGLVYLGLETTTAVNAVLLNSSAPLFMLLCSWIFEREAASSRQIFGMLISWVGIFIILGRGDADDAAAPGIPPGRRLDPARHADMGALFGAVEALAA